MVGRRFQTKETLEGSLRKSIKFFDYYGEEYGYDEMMSIFDSLFGDGEHIDGDIDKFSSARITDNGKDVGFLLFDTNYGWTLNEFNYASLTALSSIMAERYNLVESYNRPTI